MERPDDDVVIMKEDNETIRRASPFTDFFNLNLPNFNDADQPINNVVHCPAGFEIINSVIHLWPLWSAALNGDLTVPIDSDVRQTSFAGVCASNAAVESYFRAVKHGRLGNRNRVTPREFVNRQLLYVTGKVNEQLNQGKTNS